jgi:hypothetical protein
MDSSSSSYSAYGSVVKQNQALYDRYLGAYRDVLAGIQNIGNAQRQAITDFYAQRQGQADQALISRGLGNTTVQSAVNRGLTLDEAKAQSDLAEKVSRMRADYGSQMAQGIRGFLGGYSQGQSQSFRPSGAPASNSSLDRPWMFAPMGGRGYGNNQPIYGYGPAVAGTFDAPQSTYVPPYYGDASLSGLGTLGPGGSMLNYIGEPGMSSEGPYGGGGWGEDLPPMTGDYLGNYGFA